LILKKLPWIIGTGAAALAAWDVVKNLSIKAIPDLPEHDPDPDLIHQLLYYLDHPDICEKDGVTLSDEYIVNAITPAKVIIDGRYDCMDFRMGSLLRIMYVHGGRLKELSPKGARMIEDAFLNAKYWMTEPGEDSMCYWSENHQLLFAVAEYLAGQYWHDRVFTNDGSMGSERMRRGRARIEHWAHQRFDFGYSEFNSTNYYLFNVGPASNFIQFCAPEDKGLANKLKMCLDLLFFDVACFMHKFSFVAPTGRAYVDNMTGEPGDRVRRVTNHLWGLCAEAKEDKGSQQINFYAMLRARDEGGKPYYELPEAIRQVGFDNSERELKASFSLNTSELPARGFVGHGDAQIMRQMSMEAFTNPEVIYNTVSYIHKNNMFSNKFVNYFKLINLKATKHPRVLKSISRHLKPMPNGIAIQRANLYCWQAPYYALSSLQRYHPGGFGAQQMLNYANFGGKSVAFTAHPARHEEESTVGATPGYWAGYGRAPHSVQHQNVLMLMFQIPKRSGFLELYDVPQFTHTFLPEAYFDEVRIQGRYAFARLGNAFLSLTASSHLDYRPWSEISAKAFKNGLDEQPNSRFDLIQHGSQQYWVYELSDQSKEHFEAFIERIKANKVAYNGDKLIYISQNRRYETMFNGDFLIDKKQVELEHKRFDMPYCVAERDAYEINIAHNGHSLKLDYDKGVREIS